MQRKTAIANVEIASGGNVLAGLWLIVSPFILGYTTMGISMWNDIVIGIAIFIMALLRVAAPLAYSRISWTNFVLGVWLIVAPLLVTYGESPRNDIIVGVIVVCLAVWSVVAKSAAPTED